MPRIQTEYPFGDRAAKARAHSAQRNSLRQSWIPSDFRCPDNDISRYFGRLPGVRSLCTTDICSRPNSVTHNYAEWQAVSDRLSASASRHIRPIDTRHGFHGFLSVLPRLIVQRLFQVFPKGSGANVFPSSFGCRRCHRRVLPSLDDSQTALLLQGCSRQPRSCHPTSSAQVADVAHRIHASARMTVSARRISKYLSLRLLRQPVLMVEIALLLHCDVLSLPCYILRSPLQHGTPTSYDIPIKMNVKIPD